MPLQPEIPEGAAPALIIRDGVVIRDVWTDVASLDELNALPDDRAVCVPLSVWNEGRAVLQSRSGALGVRMAAHETPDGLAQDFPRLSLISIQFAQFTDGRGYSIARTLRQKMGYQGELRAVGDVLRDQLFYLVRCGFNAFALAPGRDIQAALSSLNDFSVAYQSAADQPQPLFWRRGSILASSSI